MNIYNWHFVLRLITCLVHRIGLDCVCLTTTHVLHDILAVLLVHRSNTSNVWIFVLLLLRIMNFTVFIIYLYVIALIFWVCLYFLNGFVTDILVTMNILYPRYTINFMTNKQAGHTKISLKDGIAPGTTLNEDLSIHLCVANDVYFKRDAPFQLKFKQVTCILRLTENNVLSLGAFMLGHGRNYVDSSAPSAAFMLQWIGSTLVQIMGCRLFGAKLLSNPVLYYCQLDF